MKCEICLLNKQKAILSQNSVFEFHFQNYLGKFINHNECYKLLIVYFVCL